MCTIWNNTELLFLKTKYNIVTVTIDEEEIMGFEGLKIKCDKSIKDVEASKDDVIVITGGDIGKIENKDLLKEFLKSADKVNAKFGAICAGVNILLGNKIISEEDINKYSVSKTKFGDRFVLAKPNEYVDFAIGLGTIADIYTSKEDFEETITFFKHFKHC